MSSPPSLGMRAHESHPFELGGSFEAILIGNHDDYEARREGCTSVPGSRHGHWDQRWVHGAAHPSYRPNYEGVNMVGGPGTNREVQTWTAPEPTRERSKPANSSKPPEDPTLKAEEDG